MMTVKEYAQDTGLSIAELLKKCKVYHFGKEAASIHFKPD